MKSFRATLLFALLYPITLVAFALIYLHINIGDLTPDNFPDALYFSVITQTTLGYGDIYPQNSIGRIATAAQALSGVAIIGLSLASLGVEWSRKAEAREKKLIEQSLHDSDKARLVALYTLLFPVMVRHVHLSVLLTTPTSENIDFEAWRTKIASNLPFQELANIFRPTLLITDDFRKPAIEYYFENESEIEARLRDIIVSINLERFPIIRNQILRYLDTPSSKDHKEAILSSQEIFAGQKTLRDLAIEQIKSWSGPPKHLGSHTLTPYIRFYFIYTHRSKYIIAMIDSFAQITNAHPSFDALAREAKSP